MKVLTVVGARPQFVKAAAVSRAFADIGGIEEVIVHTGQHFDENMSDVFFREMQIPEPKHRLEIHSLNHGAMTGRMLEGLEDVILAEQPRWVLVYGDTNSTLAGALAAKKLHVGVVHVEAGLRSHDMCMPEEINRVLTDRISDVLYCPTDAAIANLHGEGFLNNGQALVRTGDVMEDAARFYARMAAERSTIIEQLGLEPNRFLLCTLHRAENTDDPARLNGIIAALDRLSRDYTVVLPVHPRTRAALERNGIGTSARLIDPVGYFDMITLLGNAALVLTDSGGLQKEAYFFDRFCVILRDRTEWVELVEHGFSRLAGADTDTIVSAVEELSRRTFERTIDLYGGGRAAATIAADLSARA